jgi:GT2 family glycosyltransferase
MTPDTAAIAIGRNEGARLIRCLASLKGQADPIIYVDSGSTDGSLDAARGAGAHVVELDMTQAFTAARARNAGLARLSELAPDCVYVQVLDGDCELQPDWIATAHAALEADPGLAIVCGRRRERFPEASIYNAMIDEEWDTPVGEAIACGGDALMRRAALAEVGGYRDTQIAGEEPEMCFRLREKGWRIERLDAEMTLHDAALTRFGQWWQRARRAGHAFTENAMRHGRSPERFRVKETLRAAIWGLALPLVTLLSLFISPWLTLALLLIWPVQILRLKLRGMPLHSAFFLTVGKLPEAQGLLGYVWGWMTGKERRLIEYK